MKKLLFRLAIATLLIVTVAVLASCNLGDLGSKEVTITLKDGDTALKTLTFEKEAAITVNLDDVALSKPGYEIEGLYTDAALTEAFDTTTIATEDLTLYIKYQPRPFKIIVIDDPNSTTYTSVDVTYNGSYSLTAPTREGYLFLGYTHVQDGAPVSFPLSGTYTKTNTISISAQWKKLASIKIFDDLTDLQVGSVIYADAEGNFTLPAVTDENAGYTFGGYTIPGVTLTRQQDGSYTGKVTTDGELTATRKWNLIPSYTLTVTGLDGQNATLKTGETYNLPAAPTRTGYFFTGYKLGTADFPASGTFTWSENIVVTATWRRQATISVYNGTTLIKSYLVPESGAYSLDVPGNTDTHTFGGFKNGNTTFSATGTYLGEDDLTIMQVWNEIPTYTLTVNGLYGDDAMAPAKYKNGATFTLPEAPERDGFIFTGYTVNGQPLTLGQDGAVTFAWTTDTTVTANWVPRVYITVRDERTNAVIGTVEVVNGAYDLSSLEPAAGDRVVVEADKMSDAACTERLTLPSETRNISCSAKPISSVTSTSSSYERRSISVAERISSRCTYFCAIILAWNSICAADATFCVSSARYGAPPTFCNSF